MGDGGKGGGTEGARGLEGGEGVCRVGMRMMEVAGGEGEGEGRRVGG